MALTDVVARTARPREKAYKLADVHGLYLLVSPNGSKRWYLKYRFEGKESRIAFGAYPLVSLAKAREKRDEVRLLLSEGIHPTEKREEEKEQAQDALNTFEKVAKDWHRNISQNRWSETHAGRVWRDMERNILPAIGQRHIADLKTKDLLEPLKIVEQNGHLDLASRLRQRVTDIMRYAVQNDLIERNPAQDLFGAIAAPKATYRPALKLDKLPDFLARIERYKGRALIRLALKLTLCVFIRSSELRFARWSEIDFETSMWTIPPEREPIEGVKHSHRGSKMRTPHLVPLSRQALVILKQIQQVSGDHELIFIGDHNPRKPMSGNTVNNALRVMGYDTKVEVCGHGFRTMACSSLIESGLWSRDAVERQMSHMERNSVRAAYIHKAEHLDERRLMLQWWADYLDANRDEYVVPYEFKNI
ncbi:tyrosine-type recombinase/integrase [Pectobacteriaceae bacterium CE90]|nr:integrase arm-type DNA-binding domain-containing protein [Prodigiosinella sp. LS101]WJV54341.1 tyrosine-type recombinase/integrase [Prodigiosinella sp. LS101]WJV58702.1 tyrosine-type recombinase/integrase [Pectobacteriaceae bacterium C111]WJY14631.1 tyrosine-type recombinase/integrase [Pectobacteriaceae bacterium CE90]